MLSWHSCEEPPLNILKEPCGENMTKDLLGTHEAGLWPERNSSLGQTVAPPLFHHLKTLPQLTFICILREWSVIILPRMPLLPRFELLRLPAYKLNTWRRDLLRRRLTNPFWQPHEGPFALDCPVSRPCNQPPLTGMHLKLSNSATAWISHLPMPSL